MIPVAWVLMKKRKYKDYKVVLSKIKERAIQMKLDLKPKSIMTNMELGAIKAFKFLWPSAASLACLFHVGQACFRNFVKHGFKTISNDDDQVRLWFKKF